MHERYLEYRSPVKVYNTKFRERMENEKRAHLEDRFRVVEGFDLYDLVRVAEICLTPNVVVPRSLKCQNFKTPP